MLEHPAHLAVGVASAASKRWGTPSLVLFLNPKGLDGGVVLGDDKSDLLA
jgi:hypothetical protein